MSIARVPALDGVRGLATIAVLLAHFEFQDVYEGHWWWKPAHSGWMGVDLFFALSGFLITGILLHNKGKNNYFREFYRRRILRIFPLYYAVLLYAAFCILVIDQMPQRLWSGYDGLGWYFGFIPNVAMALKGEWHWSTNWAGLSHLWSLAVEEQFYVVWPLLVLVMPQRLLPWFCVLLIGVGPELRILTAQQFDNSLAEYMLPYCRMDSLAAGSLLAAMQHQGWLNFSSNQRLLACDGLMTAGLVVLYCILTLETPWRNTFIAVGCGCFIYLALCSGGWVNKICNNAFLRHIGHFSYGMYIFHQLLRMPYTWYVREPLQTTGLPIAVVQIIYIVLVFSLSYGLARLSWRFIEQPFLARK
jgi:peptidoglycan/LPS O-acetylase OafA/YrhL